MRARQVKGRIPITTLFLDIGGVLLTNGWDHHARKRAAETFKLDRDEMEARHRLNFAIHEEGKLTLGEYLRRVVFHRKRPFTLVQFRRFMFEQSKPYPEMIELVMHLKAKYGLKIAVVSNEARELNAYRIRKFKRDRCFFAAPFWVRIIKIFRIRWEKSTTVPFCYFLRLSWNYLVF